MSGIAGLGKPSANSKRRSGAVLAYCSFARSALASIRTGMSGCYSSLRTLRVPPGIRATLVPAREEYDF
jgi:hypothetical protein